MGLQMFTMDSAIWFPVVLMGILLCFLVIVAKSRGERANRGILFLLLIAGLLWIMEIQYGLTACLLWWLRFKFEYFGLLAIFTTHNIYFVITTTATFTLLLVIIGNLWNEISESFNGRVKTPWGMVSYLLLLAMYTGILAILSFISPLWSKYFGNDLTFILLIMLNRFFIPLAVVCMLAPVIGGIALFLFSIPTTLNAIFIDEPKKSLPNIIEKIDEKAKEIVKEYMEKEERNNQCCEQQKEEESFYALTPITKEELRKLMANRK